MVIRRLLRVSVSTLNCIGWYRTDLGSGHPQFFLVSQLCARGIMLLPSAGADGRSPQEFTLHWNFNSSRAVARRGIQNKEPNMRSMALLAVFPLVIMTPALAQDQPAKSNGNAQAIQQQVQNNLRQAGFTDIQIMPSSFLVRAKDSAGNPVMMVINPDSVTAVTEITGPTGTSPAPQGKSSDGGLNVPPGNSGAGIAGQPGNKSGPPANSAAGTTGSGTSSSAQSPSGQDASKVPGLPGSKSGPAVRPPASTSR